MWSPRKQPLLQSSPESEWPGPNNYITILYRRRSSLNLNGIISA